jgi:hypothetical protein
MVLYFLRHIVISSETCLISFLVDLWIILSYLRNTEYYLIAIDLNYIQADFFDMSSYCYLYKNSLISYYSLILFYYYPINNIK